MNVRRDQASLRQIGRVGSTRAIGRRNAGAIDVGGSTAAFVSRASRRVNLEQTQGQGGCAGDRECSRMRENWDAAIGPLVENPQPGDILQKAGAEAS